MNPALFGLCGQAKAPGTGGWDSGLLSEVRLPATQAEQSESGLETAADPCQSNSPGKHVIPASSLPDGAGGPSAGPGKPAGRHHLSRVGSQAASCEGSSWAPTPTSGCPGAGHTGWTGICRKQRRVWENTDQQAPAAGLGSCLQENTLHLPGPESWQPLSGTPGASTGPPVPVTCAREASKETGNDAASQPAVQGLA